MFFFENVCPIFVVIACYSRFVSSLPLDLFNLTNSGFYTLKLNENGVIKIMILSTPGAPITEICRGNMSIWSALPGESVKCFTYITSEWKDRKLMTIEINNPVKNDMYYLYLCKFNYIYISKEEFEKKFLILSKPKAIKRVRHRTLEAEADDTDVPRKRGGPRKQPNEQPGPTELEPQQGLTYQPLEPETVKVEISSDDETDTASEEQTDEEKKKQRKELIDKLKMKIQQKMKEKSKQLESVTTQVELSSSDNANEVEPDPQPLVPETVQVELESDEETETQPLQPSIDEGMLLSGQLFEDHVEKLLETELEDIGLSNLELDLILDEQTDESD